MKDEGHITAEIAEHAETDEHSWIPDLDISVSSVRSVLEGFGRRQTPAVCGEEIERV